LDIYIWRNHPRSLFQNLLSKWPSVYRPPIHRLNIVPFRSDLSTKPVDLQMQFNIVSRLPLPRLREINIKDIMDWVKIPTREADEWHPYICGKYVPHIKEAILEDISSVAIDSCWDYHGCLRDLFDEHELKENHKLQDYLEYIQTDLTFLD